MVSTIVFVGRVLFSKVRWNPDGILELWVS